MYNVDESFTAAQSPKILVSGGTLSAHGMEDSTAEPDRGQCGVWGCLLEWVTWLSRAVGVVCTTGKAAELPFKPRLNER